MRGKPAAACLDSKMIGITPADAGKTFRLADAYSVTADHPRGCGENCKLLLSDFAGVGSPPRMRGKRDIYTDAMALNRITPADAGKTMSSLSAASKRWDHPRGCGENFP